MRLWQRLNELAHHQPSVERLVFSEGYVKARQLLLEWGTSAGLKPRIDPVGNLWLLPPHSQPLLLGSHLDSVPGGGRFDGALGVLLGLELAERYHGVAVVDFIAEESSRFGVSTLGSSVFAGTRSLSEVLALRDGSGQSFGELREGLWSDIELWDPQPERFSGYLEAHIDQDTFLRDRQAPLGIVRHIAAPTRWKIQISGQSAHSGATPMSARHDALAAAAELVLAIEREALSFSLHELRATVGYLQIDRPSPNRIPGSAELIVDLRSLDAGDPRVFMDRLEGIIQELSARRGVRISCHQLSSDPPVSMSKELSSVLAEAMRLNGLDPLYLESWAAHDALQVARRLPAGMVLVRNQGGVSHSPLEEAQPEDLALAQQVLETALQLHVFKEEP